MSGPENDPRPWRKSTKSGEAGCVEVAILGETVLVRDSKDANGSVLTFGRCEWAALIASLRYG